MSAGMVLPWILGRKPFSTEEAACGHSLGGAGRRSRILGLLRGREIGRGKKREETRYWAVVGHEGWGTDPQSNRKITTR